MQLSRYFTLTEMTRSDTAIRRNLANEPGPREVENLRALCKAVLDPLRDAVGQPIRVNSGYRSREVNTAIGGATSSQHLHGMAADIQSPGTAVLELFKRIIRMGLPFDQLIYEAVNARTKWVHVSHNPAGNRGQIMTAKFGPDGRPTNYLPVTPAAALALAEPASALESAGGEPGYVEMDDAPAPRKRPPAKKQPATRRPAKAPRPGKQPAGKAAKKPAKKRTTRARPAAKRGRRR